MACQVDSARWTRGSTGRGSSARPPPASCSSLAIVADVWWGLDNIVPSALLEMGAAALMAAVLFFVVPHFTARVADAVMDQMTAGGGPDATAATGTEGEEERAAWERTFRNRRSSRPFEVASVLLPKG